MSKLQNPIKLACSKQRGAALVEYSILIATIAMLTLPAVRALNTGINKNFCDVVSEGYGSYVDGECKGTDPVNGDTTYF